MTLPIGSADVGLGTIVGVEVTPVEPKPETMGEALKKITPSLIVLGIATGASMAVGTMIIHAAAYALSKGRIR